MSYQDRFPAAAESLVRAGGALAAEGWVPATSGNFSLRLDDGHAAITVSGRHKGRLTTADIMCVDLEGNPVATSARPSAETLLHTRLYRRFPNVGAVLHTHSPNATVISRRRPGGVHLAGYELLKAFRGMTTHECTIEVPVFPNDQDIPRLADAVDRYLDGHQDVPGYLIAGHGLYTWGRDLDEAMRHVEAFEFLFDCELKQEA